MAGEIYHEWNGTVLTITSDSGTSSADLQGSKGDMGVRGPQGIAGGVDVDSSGYEVTDNKVDTMPNFNQTGNTTIYDKYLSAFGVKKYIDGKIVNSISELIDPTQCNVPTDWAVKKYVDNAITNIVSGDEVSY